MEREAPAPDRATQLALQTQQGGEGASAALEQLIRLTQPDVWRFCARMVGRDPADDLSQEVYVRAWRALPRYRSDASVRAWLLGIARNVILDDIRRRTRRERIAPAATGVDPEGAFGASSSPDHGGLVASQGLVGALPVDQRTAFVLTQVIGLSYVEAADACGVPIGTIRSRVARARDALMSSLEADVG